MRRVSWRFATSKVPDSKSTMYQLVVQLISPYPFLVVGLAAALAWSWRDEAMRRRGLIAASVLLGLLWALSTTVAGYLCLGSLEWSYPPSDEVPAPTDTIVVRGDPTTHKFAAFHLRDGKIAAVEAVNAAPEYLMGKKLIAEGRPIDSARLSDLSIPMKSIVA